MARRANSPKVSMKEKGRKTRHHAPKGTRAKDRHEPGTGRRDNQKRGGGGKYNWGDASSEVEGVPLDPNDPNYELHPDEEEAAPPAQPVASA